MSDAHSALRYGVHRTRYEVRKRIEQVDNAEVRDARRLLRALRTRPPRVVYLAESAASFVAPYDRDRRRLDTLVEQHLGPARPTVSINGGSYHADLLAAYAGLIEHEAARPAVIVPLWIRGRFLPWIEHPVWGHKQATRFIRELPPGVPLSRVRAGFGRPTAAEFDHFHRLVHPTFLGELTIGEYVRPLKSPRPWSGRAGMMHAYHQGARLVLDSPALDAVRALGWVLARLDVPVLAYQTPVPVESGRAYFGAAFAELAEENFAVMEAAFAQGFGREPLIVRSGTAFGSDEFIDVAGADEHLNERGRHRLAQLIVAGADRLLTPALR